MEKLRLALILAALVAASGCGNQQAVAYDPGAADAANSLGDGWDISPQNAGAPPTSRGQGRGMSFQGRDQWNVPRSWSGDKSGPVVRSQEETTPSDTNEWNVPKAFINE